MRLVRVLGEFLILTLQFDFRGGGPYGPTPVQVRQFRSPVHGGLREPA